MLPFAPRQQDTLRAAVDRIIPPDDDPGGWEAGVGDYLARQFAGDLAPLVADYRLGLDRLDTLAQASGEMPFAALTADAQDTILAAIERGEHSAASARFFALLIEHTMEGFYGDPGNGDPSGGVAWRMIGFAVRG